MMTPVQVLERPWFSTDTKNTGSEAMAVAVMLARAIKAETTNTIFCLTCFQLSDQMETDCNDGLDFG